MATFDYDQTKLLADRLITKFGQDVIIRRYANSGTEFNPSRVPDDHSAIAVIIEYTRQEIDGTLVLATDRKALIEKGDLEIEPLLSDKFVINGKEYAMKQVDPLNPGGTVVLWTAQVRF